MSVNKCAITDNSLREIQGKVINLGIKYRKDALTFKSELQNYLQTLVTYDLRKVSNIIDYIMPLLRKWESVDSQFFSAENLTNIILIKNGGSQILDVNEYGVDKLAQSE
jgi:hypothetical protein